MIREEGITLEELDEELDDYLRDKDFLDDYLRGKLEEDEEEDL